MTGVDGDIIRHINDEGASRLRLVEGHQGAPLQRLLNAAGGGASSMRKFPFSVQRPLLGYVR